MSSVLEVQRHVSTFGDGDWTAFWNEFNETNTTNGTDNESNYTSISEDSSETWIYEVVTFGDAVSVALGVVFWSLILLAVCLCCGVFCRVAVF